MANTLQKLDERDAEYRAMESVIDVECRAVATYVRMAAIGAGRACIEDAGRRGAPWLLGFCGAAAIACAAFAWVIAAYAWAPSWAPIAWACFGIAIVCGAMCGIVILSVTQRAHRAANAIDDHAQRTVTSHYAATEFALALWKDAARRPY